MMEQIKSFFLDVLPVLISIIALIVSAHIGKKQVEISQMQADFQNKVELYLAVGLYQVQCGMVPAVFIKNIGNNVVYLVKYDFNGREYPQNMFVLPPMSVCSEAYYRIDLPIDGSIHVSLKLEFEDWQRQNWQTKGYADFRNGVWELTYSPCEKRKEIK